MPADQTEGMSQSQIEKSMLTEYQQSNSILGKIGQFVEPVVRPMELGWKSCVSLIAGSAAKEVVVSTLGVLYVGDDDAELLTERLQSSPPD